MKKVSYFLMGIGFLLVVGCGPKLVPAPDWYYNPPKSAEDIYASATEVSKDRQLAVDKASTKGRAKLGQEVELHLEGLYRQFAEEVGVAEDSELLMSYNGATKVVVDKTLVGSHIEKTEVKKEGKVYRAWVLMKLPLNPVHLGIYGEMKNREHLYTRFRASQAFKELGDEVKKYREYKKEQSE